MSDIRHTTGADKLMDSEVNQGKGSLQSMMVHSGQLRDRWRSSLHSEEGQSGAESERGTVCFLQPHLTFCSSTSNSETEAVYRLDHLISWSLCELILSGIALYFFI